MLGRSGGFISSWRSASNKRGRSGCLERRDGDAQAACSERSGGSVTAQGRPLACHAAER
jgi:hypothetical protein